MGSHEISDYKFDVVSLNRTYFANLLLNPRGLIQVSARRQPLLIFFIRFVESILSPKFRIYAVI